MELKFIPYSMYAEGFVSDEDADTLENYINEDILNIEYNPIKNTSHNFLTTSPSHSATEDNINWHKYKNVFTPYIESFFKSITDKAANLNLTCYLNLCKKGSFIAPHCDFNSKNEVCFMLLYCPKKYENLNQCTTYLTSEKYYRTFSKYEKLPLTDSSALDLYHERGKFFIVPSNLYHWVTTISDDIDRVTIMVGIHPEFKL